MNHDAHNSVPQPGIRRQLLWMWHASHGLRLQAALNTICGVLLVGADFAFIFFTKQLIDVATGVRTGSFAWLAAGLVAVAVTRILLGLCLRWIGAMLGVGAQNRLQRRLFEHIMRSRWQGRGGHHSGDVLNRLEQDVRDVVVTITETVPQLLAVVVRLAGAFVFMGMMDWTIAMIVVVVLPVFILLSRVYVGRMRSLTRDVRQSDSRIQSLLQESVQHRLVVKTLLAIPETLHRLDLSHGTLRRQVRRRTVFSSFSAFTLNMGFSGVYLLTFIWAAHRLQAGAISYGMMLAFVQLVGQIQLPFRELTRYAPKLVQSLTAGERMMELESVEREDQTPPQPSPTGEGALLSPASPIAKANDITPSPVGEGWGGVVGFRLCDVSYRYPDSYHDAVSHFTATFEPGSVVAIVGETGAGKTTITRLLLGLMAPDTGTVEMFGGDWSSPCSPQTRPAIVYVPQGNTLMSGTVRDNLLLACPMATDEDMRQALHTACADFIFTMPQGLDTLCGELGAGLSEGQAQRICIARSLLRRGQVLILDEPTSALDADTEQLLLQRLVASAQGRTLIFVAHRPAVLQYCTQVVRM